MEPASEMTKADVAATSAPPNLPEPSPRGPVGRSRRLAALAGLIRAVAEVDPLAIESAARQLGESRRALAPVAWAAGTVVLLVQGVKLLILNWRLSLIQVVPAAWVWLATWDLKRHLLHGSSFAQLNFTERALLAVAVVVVTVAAFWCNTIFAFAIDAPPPPRIVPAARLARPYWPAVLSSGLILGGLLAFATVVVPRLGGVWLFTLVLGVCYAAMLISFVAVPARIIGAKRSQKLAPKQAVGRVAAGGALSAVAMGPGYLLGRLGLIFLGLHHLHILGFAMLSIGTALYAAGMSSVKAVKLTMKLGAGSPTATPSRAEA